MSTNNTKCHDCFRPVHWNNCGVVKVSLPSSSKLPKADFLALVWTDAETSALTTILGGGVFHLNEVTAGQHNLIVYNDPRITFRVHPQDGGCHGLWFPFQVGNKTGIAFKSNVHPKLESQRVALRKLVQNLVGRVQPEYLITSGTSGGVWPQMDIGDVVVTNAVRYGLTMVRKMNTQSYWSSSVNVLGARPDPDFNPNGKYLTWYDYANEHFLGNSCVEQELRSGDNPRKNPSRPQVFYKAPRNMQTTVITNSSFLDEFKDLDLYRENGAALDENDAFVVQALKAVKFRSWVSIRNISDLPHPRQDQQKGNDQYDTYGQCSSLNGAFAIWAFIMGH